MRPPQAWGVACALAALVAAVVFLSLHGLGAVKDAVVALMLQHRPVTVRAALGGLGAVDALAALAAAGLALWLALMERRRLVSRFLVEAPSLAQAVAFTLVLALLAHSYLFPGLLLGGDTGSHISRFLEMGRGFEHGVLAEWTNYQYLGSPLLEFTGPLTYVVGGALEYLLGDAVLTAKLLLFALTLGCGWLALALLRRCGLGRFGAAVGALAYTGAFAHLHLFLYRGVFPQAFTICFFLAAFLAAEGLMRAGAVRRWRDWALFAFATGGLVTTHQPHALFVAMYLAIFGLASLALGRWRLAGAGWLVSAGLVGLVMAAVAVLPVLAEARWVMIDPAGGLVHVQLPSLHRLLDLVLWRNTRTTWGTDYWAYVGMVPLVLAAIGLVHGLRRPRAGEYRRLVASVAPCLAGSFFLANPVVRDSLFMLLFLAVPASVGAERVVARFAGWPRAGLVVMGLLLLDLVSTSIQPVARTDKHFLIAEGRYLAREAPEQRVIQGVVGADGRLTLDVGPDGGPISYRATVQRVAGNHNMAATLVHNYVVTIIKMAEAQLNREGQLSPQVHQLMALLNAARIICDSPLAAGCPARLQGLRDDGVLGAVVPIADATPVLFSQRLVTLPPPPGLDRPMLWAEQVTPPTAQVVSISEFLGRYLAVARPDLATDTAAALPVLGPVPPSAPASQPATPWRPRLSHYRVELQRVRLTIESDRPGYVQLAHPWFPSNRVLVNGHQVAALEGAWHLLVVPIVAGESRIELVPGTTTVRVAAGWLSLLGVVLGLLVPLVGGGWRLSAGRGLRR